MIEYPEYVLYMSIEMSCFMPRFMPTHKLKVVKIIAYIHGGMHMMCKEYLRIFFPVYTYCLEFETPEV